MTGMNGMAIMPRRSSRTKISMNPVTVAHDTVSVLDFLTGLKPRDSCCRSDVP